MLAYEAIKASSREAKRIKMASKRTATTSKRATITTPKRVTIALLLLIHICWANPDPGPKPKAK